MHCQLWNGDSGYPPNFRYEKALHSDEHRLRRIIEVLNSKSFTTTSLHRPFGTASRPVRTGVTLHPVCQGKSR